MSFPNIPNITPLISVTVGQTVPLLLSSIALEELALAHIMNAEAEKLQFVLGTLDDTGVTFSPAEVSVGDLLDVNTSVRRTLRDVIKKEMLLEFKFENVLDLIPNLPPVLLSQQIFNFTGVIETITVPAGATLARIEAIGAAGGTGTSNNGQGALIRGDFPVTPSETLSILVGQQGQTGPGDFPGTTSGGGGGGSFVWRGAGSITAANLLVAAGGGGGASIAVGNDGVDASLTSSGTSGNPGSAGGSGGNGGTQDPTLNAGAGGAGINPPPLGNGQNSAVATGGTSIFAGGAGGTGQNGTHNGGFGGGGGGSIFSGGGGGGFSGGGGGGTIVDIGGGGGGGSQNNGTNQFSMADAGTGNGQVTIIFFGI
ncbi:hypothetical protein QNH48_14230 [Neobacillus sp. YX16]|uniref:hypothetical protein n=1 Tax=Neobacillus sp. YX16 TaxID=3047874 RepID=UPI0024C2B170|nr:hypothetical protein [Neobacillus sp. YX16]WHZ05710.1 hypothetical protein QNH48_14230 [Neobacillus sp. YX16]